MRLAPIDTIVADAIARRVFPGAVVAVARAGQLLHHSAYGALAYEPGAAPVAVDTIYDIASLTKVFTATAALRLYEGGLLDLDAPARAYLPELHAAGVAVWHLLTHTSGLDLRLSTLRLSGRDGLLASVYATTPARPPGSHVAYTNINTLLLGEIVARLCGAPLDQALDALVLAPLGLRSTRFCPPAELRERIAPTEVDDEWRGGVIRGSVHDESAHVLGGVAGHAGLFSTAADLLTFGAAWLPQLADAPALLRPATIALATRNQTPGLPLACGLGWMVDRPNFMGPAPPGSFGHTGFTGPALLIEPRSATQVVVLSNRTFPRRSAPAHHAVTAAIAAAALEHLVRATG